jgi:hypothetical protein
MEPVEKRFRSAADVAEKRSRPSRGLRLPGNEKFGIASRC